MRTHSRERKWHLLLHHFTKKGVCLINTESLRQAYISLGFSEPSGKALTKMMHQFRERKLGIRLKHGWILLNNSH
jgi:hypothetical protein